MNICDFFNQNSGGFTKVFYLNYQNFLGIYGYFRHKNALEMMWGYKMNN